MGTAVISGKLSLVLDSSDDWRNNLGESFGFPFQVFFLESGR